MNNFFKVIYRSKKTCLPAGRSKARLGEIVTDHGVIKTPGFISAATKGTIKTLTPQQVKEIGIQGACVNTYHLVTHPGADVIERAGGIHEYSQLNMPLMSDSGGFQIFSLAKNDKARDRKFFDGKQQTLPAGRQAQENLSSSLSEQIDITKSIYKNNFEKVDVDCKCYVCKNFTKSYLHHLFKQREILGYTLATYHNLWVMERLFEGIREMISKDLKHNCK